MNTGLFKNRKASFYMEIIAVLLGVGGSVYYAIQSNIDNAFNVFYLILMLCGAAATLANVLLKAEFLLPVAGILCGTAFGIIVHDMLPTMSDVWNGVLFIGGNLTAYIIYTAIAFAVAVLIIVSCFLGGETKKAE